MAPLYAPTVFIPLPGYLPPARARCPSPDSLVPTQLCLLPGSLGPGQTACLCPGLCALSGFCDLSQVWNPSLWPAMTSAGIISSAQLYSPAAVSDTPAPSDALRLGSQHPRPQRRLTPFFSSSTILILKLHPSHIRPFFSPVPQAWHWTQERRSSQMPRRIWLGEREKPGLR